MDRRTALALGATAATLVATGVPASATPEHADRTLTDQALAASLPGDFRSAYAEVNGTRLHYVVGGKGAPLVLLPGWPQTWWQFRKIMPELAKRYRVIAVDLRGQGGSAKPVGGYDKKTMAKDIHELVRHLGYRKVDIAGHDIGAMVAHSFAANHPLATRRIALLDVPHPDESMYDLTLVPRPGQQFLLWWFAFNQIQGIPEQLLTGRSRVLVDHLCGLMLVDQNAISDRDRAIYARAYSSPDAIRAGNGWYQTFPKDILDEKTYAKLTMPVLGLVNAGMAEYLAVPLRRQASDVRIIKIENTGHYLAEEQPAAVITHLSAFFG